jgi:hypothetical protein
VTLVTRDQQEAAGLPASNKLGCRRCDNGRSGVLTIGCTLGQLNLQVITEKLVCGIDRRDVLIDGGGLGKFPRHRKGVIALQSVKQAGA